MSPDWSLGQIRLKFSKFNKKRTKRELNRSADGHPSPRGRASRRQVTAVGPVGGLRTSLGIRAVELTYPQATRGPACVTPGFTRLCAECRIVGVVRRREKARRGRESGLESTARLCRDMAEREGFEPSMPRTRRSGFRVPSGAYTDVSLGPQESPKVPAKKALRGVVGYLASLSA